MQYEDAWDITKVMVLDFDNLLKIEVNDDNIVFSLILGDDRKICLNCNSVYIVNGSFVIALGKDGESLMDYTKTQSLRNDIVMKDVGFMLITERRSLK